MREGSRIREPLLEEQPEIWQDRSGGHSFLILYRINTEDNTAARSII